MQKSVYILVCFSFVAGCSHLGMAANYTEPINSLKDIRAANPNIKDIDIRDLDAQYYPLLAKFAGLERIKIFGRQGTNATDDKLKTLGALHFPNLYYIDLNNNHLVTDSGIGAIAKLPRLSQLQLEGTAITDQACHVFVQNMRLKVINLANCTNVTRDGLMELIKSPSLAELRFSADTLTEKDVLAVLELLNKGVWVELVDTTGKLNVAKIKEIEERKHIHALVRATGALQDHRLR